MKRHRASRTGTRDIFKHFLINMLYENKLSKAEFAKRIGCSRQTVYRYLDAQTRPSELVVQQICDLFGKSSKLAEAMFQRAPAGRPRFA